MFRLLLASLSPLAGFCRVHVSGDFYSQEYFDAWLDLARERAWTRFYFYTKSLNFWMKRLKQAGTGHAPGEIENVIPTASWGGRFDHLIPGLGLRSSLTVLSEKDAADQGLELDHDDGHARVHGDNFALLIHGIQPAGTPAAKSVANLRKMSIYGYGPRAAGRRVPLQIVR